MDKIHQVGENLLLTMRFLKKLMFLQADKTLLNESSGS